MEIFALIAATLMAFAALALSFWLIRQSMRRTTESASSSQASTTELLTAQREMFETTLAAVLTAMQTTTATQTATTLQALQELSSKATSGTHSTLDTLADLVREQSRLLGVKDPVAYQMIAGAGEPPLDDAALYTTGDELEQDRLDEATRLLEAFGQGGVTGDGDNPYAAAESAAASVGGIPGI